MRLIYLSQGNIPSKWAHTFQAMKMAEALAGLVPDFRLVTQARWTALLQRRFDFERWYGIRQSFPIVRLPIRARGHEDLFIQVYDRRFDRMAALYASCIKPDCVVTRSPHAGMLCVRRGLKTIIESHNNERSRDIALICDIAHDPDLVGVVTVTETLKESYVRSGISASKILVWPDAVDPANYLPAADRENLRVKLSLPLESPIAAYVGHFYEEKGAQYLIDVARLLPEVNFVLVGGWPHHIECMSRLASGMKNVFIVGFVPNCDVPNYLAAADILLLPNSGRFPQASTTSPLKLFEYMASGRPVVATGIPALHGLLRDQDNALVVTPDSPIAIRDGIASLLADPALAARLASNGLKDIQAFTWSRRARDVIDFISRGSA